MDCKIVSKRLDEDLLRLGAGEKHSINIDIQSVIGVAKVDEYPLGIGVDCTRLLVKGNALDFVGDRLREGPYKQRSKFLKGNHCIILMNEKY